MNHTVVLRRSSKAEEIASIAQFLASDKSSYITGMTFSDDRTQARPKRHPNAALTHRGGPGVSARFAHRKLPFICAQNNGIPLGSCADSFTASHGSATSRRPTREPAGSQAPVVAHTNVLELESRPKSYTG